LVIGLSLSAPLYAQPQPQQGLLAPSRSINWGLAGAGVIPTRSQICATLNPGATAAQINSAISSCVSGQVIKLNAGTYNISGIKFDAKNNVTLRGAGPDQTFLIFSAQASCGGKNAGICVINGSANWVGNSANVGDSAQENNADWTGGYAQGSTVITLSARTLGTVSPTVGTTLILDQLEDGSTRAQDTGDVFVCTRSPACTQENGGNGRTLRAQQQLVTVTSVSGSGPYTLGITPAISMPNWRSSQAPKAWWANKNYITGVGIEDLSLDCTACDPFGVTFFNATNSWLKNVRSIRNDSTITTGSDKHVLVFQSTHITVRDSYFFGRSDGDEYGVNIWESSDTLIENNIFQRVPLPILHETGTGTVAAYNYTINNLWNNGTWSQGSVYGHGGHEDFILAEGNDGFGLEMENYYGFAHFVTSFRNRWTGFETGRQNQTVPMFVYGLNRYANIIGNVLGTAGYHTKYQAVPGDSSSCTRSVYAIGLGDNCADGDGSVKPLNDSFTLTSTMRWGNYDVATNTVRFMASEVPSALSLYANPVPSSQALPASLYLPGRPSYWGSLPWPAIGPEVTGGDVPGVAGHAYRIPARRCFEDVMKGSFSDSTPRTFSSATCYGNTSVPPPSAPTNLRIIR